MQNEAFTLDLPTRTVANLQTHLWELGDRRALSEVVAILIKEWIEGHTRPAIHWGYQWGEMYLPHHTQLRFRYAGEQYYAEVVKNDLIANNHPTSPRQWMLEITGTVRNPWRDIWIRRTPAEYWTRACTWRTRYTCPPSCRYTERRRWNRRASD